MSRYHDAVTRGLARLRAHLRAHRRSRLTPGWLHADGIVRDCIDKRQGAEEMRVRLMVAATVADRWVA